MSDIKDNLVILIVEDYVLHRTILVGMLKNMGYLHVLEAQDGFDALEVCEHNRIDILFCDLRLPSMDGMALLRRLSSKEFKGGIILSSVLENDVVDAVLRMGNEYGLQVLGRVDKPTSHEQLQALISRWAPVEDIFREHKPAQHITEVDLNYAIQHGQLEPWFQPKVHFSSGEWTGVEVLARWHHPTYGMISPDVFIPLAEKHGLMHSLTELIIREALSHYHECAKIKSSLNMSLNLSASSLVDKSLSNFLLLHCGLNQINTEQIILEITESAFTEDIGQALEILTRLRMHGFGISIDDFGTGYSSLQQLALLPFTELKLDRSFVDHCHSMTSHMAIVESSIKLANNLGLKTVAEGVEDIETWQRLDKLGCHTCQGFIAGKAMPHHELAIWHEDWKCKVKDIISG
ncbi:EAL domain-containing response regulator [Aeromonas veronii]|uniref:EAL domain-containing response regulator n=1 Tax=Aeromonas veronii TaxID=654 RepID=UPI00226D1BD6|nr:EAL domain-containing response regulator [Aeromonas veronii]MCX9134877.1 EAL domain-containing response regulator [Aeromonas veronii]